MRNTLTQSVPSCLSWRLVYRDKLLAAVGPHLLYAIKGNLEKKEITKPIKSSGLTKPCFLKTVCKTDIVYFPQSIKVISHFINSENIQSSPVRLGIND